ncbi:MAG: SgcJ/EcaC family oxidoreductase [Nitrospira sp.]
MSAQTPDQLHSLFLDAFNRGNVEAVLALYEPAACLIPQPSQAVRGQQAIRNALQQFMALHGRMTMSTTYVVLTDDLALLRGQWTLTGIGPDGKAVEMVGDSVEVARRQPNGDWLFAIDHPFGAGRS